MSSYPAIPIFYMTEYSSQEDLSSYSSCYNMIYIGNVPDPTPCGPYYSCYNDRNPSKVFSLAALSFSASASAALFFSASASASSASASVSTLFFIH